MRAKQHGFCTGDIVPIWREAGKKYNSAPMWPIVAHYILNEFIKTTVNFFVCSSSVIQLLPVDSKKDAKRVQVPSQVFWLQVSPVKGLTVKSINIVNELLIN